MKKFTVNSDSNQEAISEALSFIRERVNEYHISSKEETRANLMTEEALTYLIEHGSIKDGGDFYAGIHKFLGRVTITLKVPGEKVDFLEVVNPEVAPDDEYISSEAYDTIQTILLHSFEDRLRYSHRRGFNTITVIASRFSMPAFWWTLSALVSAFIIGALLKGFASESFYSAVNSIVLVRVKSIYMNVVKAIVTPLIFFAILNCFTQFKSFSEIGRVGSKIVTAFLIKMFISACIGTGIFFLIQPCDGLHLSASNPSVSVIAHNNDLIVGMFPSNFVSPFLEMNMFQILFLSFLCGAGMMSMGESGKILREFFDSCCQLFMAVTKIVMRFLPLAGFCSILSAILETDSKILLSFTGFIFTIALGMLCILSVSCIQLFVLGRLNPFKALRKFVPAALIAMASSTTASIPSNMQACGEMGVPKKIHSFSIPLGATISLDAAAMYTALSSLMLAKIYGVHVPSESILPLIISVTILTVSAPGVTGASLVCISIAIAQLGVPAEALGIIMGIDAIQNFMHPPVNSFSAIASTLTVSSREKILDKEKFYA